MAKAESSVFYQMRMSNSWIIKLGAKFLQCMAVAAFLLLIFDSKSLVGPGLEMAGGPGYLALMAGASVLAWRAFQWAFVLVIVLSVASCLETKSKKG